ncbi:Disease resistance RPP13-like protein 4 [Camellia lanceoleosa]|uniref:Disease resistance RPP13-like protein 4 n=1 Tax=Camellia lanceoleosa TaxID=1840588 RepID=A0ACC0H3P2_9ERIC|nr:Disease resistance RPP13-like protein 4 [Camellia lanceoleosa]
MLHKIHQLLSHKLYLIVMDDVWSTTNGWWDRISSGLPKTLGHSSCIIITTRNEEVTKNMGVVDARIHRPKLLDEEESWSLFCKVAFMATKGIYHEINAEQLVRWWIGEGFMQKRRLETATETAYRFLSELIGRCLVEVMRRRSYDGRVYSCKMHDMVRDLMIRIAREEEFSCFDDGDINQESTIEDEELGALADLQKLRVLLINAENCEDVNILEKLNKLTPPPHLEELYFGHYYGEATPDWINPNSLPELQYLCLEYARLVDMSPFFWSSDGGNSWKVEGLCLKFLPRLQVEWSRV